MSAKTRRERFERCIWISLMRYLKIDEPELQIDYPERFANWLEERETLLNGE